MQNFIVFAAIGVLTGGAARLLYSDRRPSGILGTALLGAAGGVTGGVLSWTYWPSEGETFHFGNLVLSFTGAILVIVFSVLLAVARARSVAGNTAR